MSKEPGKYWHGGYRGVAWKIQSWKLGGDYTWNYYIYIDLSKITDKEVAKRLWTKGKKMYHTSRIKSFNTYEMPVINDIDMHGGVTWYTKSYSLNDTKTIEVGCDYSHLADDGLVYDLNEVEYDAKHSIDRLLEHLPELEKQP